MVDPWGTVVAEYSEGEGVCTAEINLDYVQKIRQQMPVQSHRRSDLYGYRYINVDSKGKLGFFGCGVDFNASRMKFAMGI